MKLLEERRTGVYHVADRDCLSRYHIAKTILKVMGLDWGLVEKGVAAHFARGQNIPVDLHGILPVNTCLDVGKTERHLRTKMLTFEEVLEMMRKELRLSC